MFIQSYICHICQISVKNNSTMFLTLSKLFDNFDFTIINVLLTGSSGTAACGFMVMWLYG